MSAAIEVPGGPEATGVAGEPWWAWSVRVLARTVLWAVAALLLWSLVPAVLGWPTRVVVSGSMAPVLRPGDVVVAQPVGERAPEVGQVVVFADPSAPGRDVVHRVVGVEAGGYLTRGDANSAADPLPVPAEQVRGIARARIPLVGLPRLWVREHDVRALVAALALLAGLALAAVDGGGRDGAR
ncbi:signal peptidase I [Kineococcus sp. SYSU DK006]|uniref:signal peptidase I n=1 Tax=Kineococcus sp. SYSU DK006 TaxID=3383127 RepID=UPI003D7C64FE